MRVAREWQVPHSVLSRDWTSRDVQLAIAHLLERDDVGPCGHPHSKSTLPGSTDRYQVDASKVCAACAVIEKHRRDHDGQTPPGALLRVVDVTDGPAGDPEGSEFGPVFA